MAEAFDGSTFIPLGELRPGWGRSPKFSDPKKAGLHAAYLALTENQKRVLEMSIQQEKGLKATDLIAARLNPAEALRAEPETETEGTEYADMSATGLENPLLTRRLSPLRNPFLG